VARKAEAEEAARVEVADCEEGGVPEDEQRGESYCCPMEVCT